MNKMSDPENAGHREGGRREGLREGHRGRGRR